MRMDQATENSIINNANVNNFIESISFSRDFINLLLKNTFEGVGLENVKRMAPKNTHN